jgi:N-acetylmuramoyl-L-alanine amidase
VKIDPIFLVLSTQRLLALTAYAEARGDGSDGMQAVLEVIRNRTQYLEEFADKSILGSTKDVYKSVILKPYQFSAFNADDPQYQLIKSIASDFSYHSANDNYLNLAYIMAGRIQYLNSVGSATHYHSISIAPPSWASSIPYVTMIGHHLFYGEVVEKTKNVFIVLAMLVAFLIWQRKNK